MKARHKSDCAFCTTRIVVGVDIAPHPNVPGKWVHTRCLKKEEPMRKLAAQAPSYAWMEND